MQFFKGITSQTLLGVFLGIIVGLFFGDDCKVLQPFAKLYISLLQIFVYPYLICTLLSGLGKLPPGTTLKLFKRGWLIFVMLLLISFTVLAVLGIAFPKTISLTTSLHEISPPDFIELLVSSNIFAALSSDRLPAVIIFCLILGPMLQRVKNANRLFQILDVISNASLEFWRILIKVAPYAVFVIIAYVTGTAKLSQLAGASVYLILFFAGSLMLTFWIYPVLIVSFIPMSFKEFVYHLREPLVIGATTNTPLALPYIQQMAIKYFKPNESEFSKVKRVIETTMIISFSFAYAGGYFVYLFILFAISYFNHPLLGFNKIWLLILSYIASIGGSVASVSFITQWLNLPKETINIAVGLLPFTRFNAVLVNVMSLATCTLLITAAYLERISIKYWNLLFHFILVSIVLFFVIKIGDLIPDPAFNTYQRLTMTGLDENVTAGIKVTMMPPLDEKHLQPETTKEDSLTRIHRTGVLRVGYNSSAMPYAYFNKQNVLVGYDVTYMYNLARVLNARIEFIPYTIPNIVSDLRAHAFDIAIGGLIANERRLQYVLFTNDYLKSLPSFIVPIDKRPQFETSAEIIDQQLKIGTLESQLAIDLIRKTFPKSQIIILPNAEQAFSEALAKKQVDAILWTNERSQLWVLGHPEYVSVSPSGLTPPLLLAYIIDSDSNLFLNFLNYWLRLKLQDGFQEKTFNKWILVRPSIDEKPRWSIIRNVFHWE